MMVSVCFGWIPLKVSVKNVPTALYEPAGSRISMKLPVFEVCVATIAPLAFNTSTLPAWGGGGERLQPGVENDTIGPPMS